MRRATTVIAATLAFAGAMSFSPAARAQGMDPDAERARQLIHKIRTSMKEIDALLLKGGDPAKIDAELAANQKRIEELLDETESKTKSVIQNLDELIKLGKKSSSSSPPPPPSQGESEGEGQDQRGKKRDKSQDPQELQQQPEQKDQPQDQQPKPEPKGGDPKDGKADPSDGQQRDANKPPPLGPTGEFERTDLRGRWGMLPPKDAEELQRRSADEFPQRYRPWMELYFRRMSRLPRH
jgi:ribosomal protein L12E/L44/L45/RPP1/RPP2